jgi:FHS family L-fucose permease-like MFS transporter
LETTANPFILSLGDKESSTRRLNFAQAFNPVGSLSGMAIASFLVLPHLLSDKRDEAGKIIFGSLSEAEKANIRLHDLAIIRDPYVAIGLVVLCIFIIIALTKMPKVSSEENTSEGTHSVKETLTNLWNNTVYREGVFTQVCYVAAQIMVWTFIIQYADHLGINKATAQVYNIIAMSLNLIGRFVGTYIMKFVNTRLLLTIFGIGASVCTLGAICIEGMFGLYSLILISLFISIMFPSIYGIALENVDSQDTKLGAAFLVMAIVGGALMPPLQGMIIDQVVIMGYPAVNISFVLPLICFLIIIVYGYRSFKRRMLG